MSRRFAPRNDMQKLAGWLRLPGALPEYCRKTVLSSRSAPAFSMSLRTSAHTGVAIRVPAWKLCKLAILRANLLRLSDLPKALIFVLFYCRESGLSRRFAPRNDMQKLAGWLRLPGALPEYCRKTVLSSRSAPAFSMSLRTSAHTGVAIRSPRSNNQKVSSTFGEFVGYCGFAQAIALHLALQQGERIAPSLRSSQ